MTTRYSDGGVTVTLDGGLEEWMRSLLSAAETETVRVIEDAADAEARKSEDAWYGPGGVTRRTGRSGEIKRVTIFSPGEVRVSVGSTDQRIDSQKKKLTPLYVRRPGPLSLIDKYVTQGEWWAWKEARKPVGKAGSKGKSDWVIRVPNPKASDGKFLMVELVRKPVTAMIKAIAPDIAQAIATKASGR